MKKIRIQFLNRKDLFEIKAKLDKNQSNQNKQQQSNMLIYVSFFQIYMERINDLIGEDKKSNLKIRVNIFFSFF